MSTNVFKTLQERGFVKQTSHEKEIIELLQSEKVTFYVGFDPTADSLHIGHYVQLMAISHMQKAGHRPIILLGGGTTTIGDPSGKTDMRKMMDREQINNNVNCFKQQMSKFISFEENVGAIMVDNAQWLLELNYVDFLREVGVHFSVNRMLAADCYKQRLHQGLTFMEFNYMIMQSYDFLHLNKKYGAKLQLGGDDQWSNILAGADLIRRKTGGEAFAMTFSLLTTSEGKKMGKTEKGAIWLDATKTSPYEFYQYWRNIADADVEKCLYLLTFIETEKIQQLCSVSGSEINETKKVLAFEITRLIHGEQEATKAQIAAQSLFGGEKDATEIPETKITLQEFEQDSRLVNMLFLTQQAKSKGDARRLIEGGGIFVGEEKISDANYKLEKKDVQQGVIIQKGKKSFKRLILD